MSVVFEDFDKCCRWCLMKPAKLDLIFNLGLADIFQKMTSVKMERMDGYPQHACRWCITKLNTFFNFYQMALKNHKTLTSILEQHQSTVQTSSENQRNEEQTPVKQQIKDELLSTDTESDDKTSGLVLTNISIKQTYRDSETTLDEEQYNTQKLSLLTNDHDYVMQSDPQATVLLIKKEIDDESDCRSDVDGLTTPFEGAQEKKCKICQNEFVDANELKVHLQSHKVRCEVCYRLIYKLNLEKHRELHTKDLRKLECKICQHRFPTKQGLDIHVRTVHLKKKGVFLCSYCGSSFKMESSLSRHLNTHTGRNLRICDICDKKFLSRYSLIEHLKSHDRVKPYSCESCGSGFTQMSSLRKHRRLLHAAGGQFKCAVCDALFDSREALRKHKRLIHGRHRCYRCKISFDDTSALEAHNSELHPKTRKARADTGRPRSQPRSQPRPRRKRPNASTIAASTLPMEYWCCGCGEAMPALEYLKEHSNKCKGASQTRVLQCKVCPTMFADSQTLFDHYSKSHQGAINAPGGQKYVVIRAKNLLSKDATSKC